MPLLHNQFGIDLANIFQAYFNLSSNYGTLFHGRMIYLEAFDLLQAEQLGYGSATIHPCDEHTFFEGFYMLQ